MRKIGLLLLILVLPALVFARGAGQPSGAAGGYLRFAWWGNPTRDERTIAVVRMFEQRNPGVTIETETAGFDAYWTLLATQAAAGNLPDVMQQDVSFIAQYTERNQLVDMSSFSRSGVINLSQWTEAGLSSGTLNGRLVGLPLGTNTWGMGVDRAVVQRAGVTINDTTWTWREYEQYALQIFQRTQVQTMPIVQVQEYLFPIQHIVRQFGVALYAPDGRSLGFTNNTQAQAAVRELIDMQNRLQAAGALYDPQDAAIAGRAMEESPLAQGRTWNNFHWSNQHIGHQNAAGRPLDYLMFPSVSGNRAPFGAYLRPSQYISILTSSRNQDMAARFVDFFVNDLEANRILMAERGIPLPSNVQNDLAGRVDADNKYLFDFIAKITPFCSPIDPPEPARSGEVRDVMAPILLQSLTGRLGSDAALNQMIQAGNGVLSR